MSSMNQIRIAQLRAEVLKRKSDEAEQAELEEIRLLELELNGFVPLEISKSSCSSNSSGKGTSIVPTEKTGGDGKTRKVTRASDASVSSRKSVNSSDDHQEGIIYYFSQVNVTNLFNNIYVSAGSSASSSSVDNSGLNLLSAVTTLLSGAKPKPKTNALSSFVFTLTEDEFVESRRELAVTNELSKQAKSHDPRKGAVAKETNIGVKGTVARPCSKIQFDKHLKKVDPLDHKVVKLCPDKSIWCYACGDTVREDNLVKHCKCVTHINKRKAAINRKLYQANISENITSSATLSKSVAQKDHMFRVSTVRSFLVSGIPLNKCGEDMQNFLQDWAKRELVTRSALQANYLPIVQEQELNDLKEELKNRPLRVTFDETTIVYCNFCVVVGFVDDRGHMQQRVVRLAQYLEAPEERQTNTMSDFVIATVEEHLQLRREQIKVFTRDGAAINELAILKLVGGEFKDPDSARIIVWPAQYRYALNIKCYSHTLDRAGAEFQVANVKKSRIEGPHVRAFYVHLNGLFSSVGDGPNSRWWAIMGTSMPSVSATRWWSKEEFYEYVLIYFERDPTKGRLVTIMDWVKLMKERVCFDGAHFEYLYKTLVDTAPGHEPATLKLIVLELALVVDVSKPIREATYILETDGPVALILTDVINRTKSEFDMRWDGMDWPNVRRLLTAYVAEGFSAPTEADGATPMANWVAYCKEVTKPCVDYFINEVVNHPCAAVMRAAALANPDFMTRRFKPANSDALRTEIAPLVGKLVTPALVDRMVMELARYTDLCVNFQWRQNADPSKVLKDGDKLDLLIEFWCDCCTVPAWREYAQLCYLLQPSSASVERAFSILKQIYNELQTRSLVDLVETTLMLRYNRKRVNKDE